MIVHTPSEYDVVVNFATDAGSVLHVMLLWVSQVDDLSSLSGSNSESEESEDEDEIALKELYKAQEGLDAHQRKDDDDDENQRCCILSLRRNIHSAGAAWLAPKNKK